MKHPTLNTSTTTKDHFPTRAQLMLTAKRNPAKQNIAHADTQVGAYSGTSVNAVVDSSAPASHSKLKMDGTSRTCRSKTRVDAASPTNKKPSKPLDVVERTAIETLRCFERFRIIRTLDVATNCFAERPYTAAQKAARRSLTLLLRRGAIKKFLSEHHQTFYAMTSIGAACLRSTGLQATSSIGRASALTNPTHTLWINFVTLSFEARGIQAFTESEIMRMLSAGKGSVTKYQSRGVLEVTPSPKRGSDADLKLRSKKVTLLPDAIATEDDGLTWIEVDTSERGSSRMARLVGLLHKMGKVLSTIASAHCIPLEQAGLKRISIHFSDSGYLKRMHAKLMDLVDVTKDNVLTESANNIRLVRVEDDIFEVYRAGDTPTGQADFCMGHVVLQMLPIGLPAFKSNMPDRSHHRQWFEGNHLPYRRPSDLGPWPHPRTAL
ncbi:hypothetical protein [Burkholderia sp. LMU1-1-1.1]|uniref:hypothetical protein n=1 Tax=Burkholderia sp. LMU1-1-1.1 TaxID=3135266 RepID=UPI00341925C6